MKVSGCIAVTLLTLVAGVAPAEDNVKGRNWAATCTGCHGTNGHSEGGMPTLAGLDKLAIINSMNEFKTGTKPATLMHQLAKGYSDLQIERIAAYFAAQAPK